MEHNVVFVSPSSLKLWTAMRWKFVINKNVEDLMDNAGGLWAKWVKEPDPGKPTMQTGSVIWLKIIIEAEGVDEEC